MKRKSIKGFLTGFISLVCLVAFAHANAAGVIVSNLSDDGSATRFDGTVGQTGAQDEVVTIGMANGFAAVANDLNGGVTSSLDTLFMTLTAPDGFVISSVSFSESGTHANTSDGFSGATGSITIDGTPISLGTHILGSTAGLPVAWMTGDLVAPIDNKKEIDVTLVNSLFAFLGIPGADKFASVQKNTAVLTVGLTEFTPIPLPPAVWMMGAALAALVTVSRRNA